jgi:hypothetical protein
MNYKMGWKGSAAVQAFTPGGRELVFDLAEGLVVPDEFNEGDEIDIDCHSDHPANVSMGMNSGHYEFTHLKSGKKFQVPHATSEWRFDKVCQPCDLRIQKSDRNCVFKKPGKVVPAKLQNFHVLRDALHSSVCPLCGNQMKQDLS